MALITGSLWFDICLGLCTLVGVLYYYLCSIMNHWKNHGVPFIKPLLFVGSFKDLVIGRSSAFEVFDQIYKKLDGERFGGYFEFVVPILMVRDLELIERVLVKDFTHFTDRGFGTVDPVNDPLSSGLANLSGDQWRNLRYKLTPTFTSAKLKHMFEQIFNCGEHFLKELEEHSERKEPVEARQLFSSFTCDVIATCAFGMEFSSGQEKEEFRNYTNQFFSPSTLQLFKILFLLYFPRFANRLGLTMFTKKVTDYFLRMTKDTIKFRRENNIQRNDFLHLLLMLQENERSGRGDPGCKSLTLFEEDFHLQHSSFKTCNENNTLELTDEVLAAQAFLFLGAGADTVSNTLALTLYCIATNPTVQAGVQSEVDLVLARHGGEWSYMAVKEMTYLDMVIQEGMRLHPFSPVLQRVCTSPYKMPGSNLSVPKGQRVVVPVYPVHHDPQHYPDPETFDPERFRGNNFRSSSKYMPFGDGPRMCIAMRFAVVEMKICLARMLSRFCVTLNDKTQRPLRFDPRAIIPLVVGGVWLDFKVRNKQLDIN